MRGALDSKRRALLVVGALLLAAFATWAVVRGEAFTGRAEAQAAGETQQVEVTGVVDGDTIEVSPSVEGVSDVRLIGVDTPCMSRDKCRESEEYADPSRTLSP